MKLFVDNLTHVDFSYLHPQRGLLGESWAVQLVLEGQLDQQGMICDFGIVKKRVKAWLDAHIDHALVVAMNMPGLKVALDKGETQINWTYPAGERFYCRSPEQAIALIPVAEITETTLAQWCREQLLALFPEQVKGLDILFVAEKIESSFYHYSHGLQQHDGNCQRIAHGHRSRIEVFRNALRDQTLEAQWAETFRDIYIGTRSHLISEEGASEHRYRYDAPQGEFELHLPAAVCYVMESVSTVEQIATHLAQQIKLEYPDDDIVVRAYEGVGKGAIATA